jgi:hypothetical protein
VSRKDPSRGSSKLSKLPRETQILPVTSEVTEPPAPAEPPPVIETDKVAKNDDARVPVELWDARIWEANIHVPSVAQLFRHSFNKCPLESLRSFFLRVWRKRLTREVTIHLLSNQANLEAESDAIRECIEKATKADW